jgi:hypothetical protein
VLFNKKLEGKNLVNEENTERIPLRRAVAVSKFPLHLGAIQDDSLRNA